MKWEEQLKLYEQYSKELKEMIKELETKFEKLSERLRNEQGN